MVFYLKYRPQKIDDLDNQDVRSTLKSVLSKNPPHAFLFTGPKGLGKTSSARIVAKVVNCTGRTDNKELKTKNKEPEGKILSSKSLIQSSELAAGVDIEPCNKCESCKSITEGNNLDVLEIDAASNRGIDEIRELKEKIRLAPVSSKVKVYIIDEVHMLTTEAFNALLKTLEEPPPHAIFILATTEAHKVPATIMSRCFHVGFRKATSGELVRSFERIVKGEKIKIDKKSLEFIASISDGAFRDGAKILEEISVIADGKPITAELIEEKYKFIALEKNVEDFILYLKARDVQNALKSISVLEDSGVDIKYFVRKTIDCLHRDLLVQIQDGQKSELDLRIDEIKEIIEALSNAYSEIKYAVIPQLPLELAVIGYTARVGSDPKISDGKKAENDENGNQYTIQDKSYSIGDLRKQQGNIRKVAAMYGSVAVKRKSPEDRDATKEEVKVSLLETSNGEITEEWLNLFWRSLLSEIKNYNHTLAGVLRGCRIEVFDKNNLVIETAFKFHKEKLDDTKIINEITRITKLLTGREMKVEVQLKSK
jgi:DNA polymerase III subunit gamma/tau